jgi:hypothetical protein
MKPTVRRSAARKGSEKERWHSKALERLSEWTRKAYERLLGLPGPVVLTVLWLMGVVFLGSCAAAFYLYGSALARMLLGP